MTMRRRTIGIVGAAAAVAAVAAGIAVASIPDGVGNIHACGKLDGGEVRVIDPGAGDACKTNEATLQWNVIPPHGPTGPQGPPGPTGPQGPQGAQGASGANAVTYNPKTMIVSASVSAAQQIGGFFISLTCPQGTKALMGSWDFSAWAALAKKPPPMGESWPIADDEWGFAVEAGNQSIGSAAYVYLHCAIAR
jgi:hypothetical protein